MAAMKLTEGGFAAKEEKETGLFAAKEEKRRFVCRQRRKDTGLFAAKEEKRRVCLPPKKKKDWFVSRQRPAHFDLVRRSIYEKSHKI